MEIKMNKVIKDILLESLCLKISRENDRGKTMDTFVIKMR